MRIVEDIIHNNAIYNIPSCTAVKYSIVYFAFLKIGALGTAIKWGRLTLICFRLSNNLIYQILQNTKIYSKAMTYYIVCNTILRQVGQKGNATIRIIEMQMILNSFNSCQNLFLSF